MLTQVAAELATGHVKTCILGHGNAEEHDHAKAMTEDELFEELGTTMSRLMCEVRVDHSAIGATL